MLRRGFSLTPLVVILALLLLGLVAWRLNTQLTLLDQKAAAAGKPSNDFFVRNARGKIYTTNVSLLLIPLAVAGGVGAACYFIFGRRAAAAQIGLAIPLGLTVASLTYQRLNYLAGNGPSTSPAGSSGPIAGAPNPSPAPAPAPIVTRPGAPGQPPPGYSPPPAAPSTTASPLATPAQPVTPPFDAAPILNPMGAEIQSQCTTLAAAATGGIADAKRPKRTVKDLDAQIERLRTLGADATALSERIQATRDDAEKRLTDAGAPLGDAAMAGHRFDVTIQAFERRVAADKVQQFTEAAIELLTIHRDNLGKTRVDAKGEITSKIPEIETKLFHARARFDFTLRLADDALKMLNTPVPAVE